VATDCLAVGQPCWLAYGSVWLPSRATVGPSLWHKLILQS